MKNGNVVGILRLGIMSSLCETLKAQQEYSFFHISE